MSSAVQVFARFRPPNAMEVDSERRFGDEDTHALLQAVANCLIAESALIHEIIIANHELLACKSHSLGLLRRLDVVSLEQLP